MNIRIRYAVLGLLAVVALYTGLWACFSPARWYAELPGFGRSRLPHLIYHRQHLDMYGTWTKRSTPFFCPRWSWCRSSR